MINKNDCYDCGNLDPDCSWSGPTIYRCMATGIILGTKDDLSVFEEDCPHFVYQE